MVRRPAAGRRSSIPSWRAFLRRRYGGDRLRVASLLRARLRDRHGTSDWDSDRDRVRRISECENAGYGRRPILLHRSDPELQLLFAWASVRQANRYRRATSEASRIRRITFCYTESPITAFAISAKSLILSETRFKKWQ